MSKAVLRQSSAAALVLAALATPAYAQDVAPVAADETDVDIAEDGGAIVVTARRREERLLDVPVAVQAHRADQARTKRPEDHRIRRAAKLLAGRFR